MWRRKVTVLPGWTLCSPRGESVFTKKRSRFQRKVLPVRPGLSEKNKPPSCFRFFVHYQKWVFVLGSNLECTFFIAIIMSFHSSFSAYKDLGLFQTRKLKVLRFKIFAFAISVKNVYWWINFKSSIGYSKTISFATNNYLLWYFELFIRMHCVVSLYLYISSTLYGKNKFLHW